MQVWIIENNLSDGSNTYDVRVQDNGRVVDLNAVDYDAAYEAKQALLAGINAIVFN